jgi:outer membrane protein assembly factor BamB
VRQWTTTICCSALALITPCVQPSANTIEVPIIPARLQWSIALNNALTALPGFNGSRAYFPIEGERLVAYDLESGNQLWIVAARPIFAPVATERLVFVVVADAVVALDAANGREVWRRPLADAIAVRPVWHDGRLAVATVPGTLFLLQDSDGQIVWRRDVGARTSAPPAITADRVYVPLEDRRVVALALADGAAAWERRVGGTPTGVLAQNDRIYVGATDNYLYSLRTERGDVAWRWRTGADVVGVAAADDQLLYFLALDNILRALDRDGGSQEWQRALPLRPRSGPILAGRLLIVHGLAPSIRGFTAATGAPAGEIALPGDLAAPPHVFVSGGLPVLVAVTGDIVKGATVAGFTPAIGMPAPFAPLPNQPAVPALTLP